MTEPILIRCEGSGSANPGWCPMCATVFAADPIPEHARLDVLAMLDRGDFDEHRN
jgi:hypothetical protein